MYILDEYARLSYILYYIYNYKRSTKSKANTLFSAGEWATKEFDFQLSYLFSLKWGLLNIADY